MRFARFVFIAAGACAALAGTSANSSALTLLGRITPPSSRETKNGWLDFGHAALFQSQSAWIDVALTFADYLSIKNRQAQGPEQLTEETIRFIEEVERVTGRQCRILQLGSALV